MKKSTWLIMILALVLVGSTAPVGQISAADKFTPFEGTDTLDPFKGVGSITAGTTKCPGHEPLGLTIPGLPPITVCPPGSRTHTRGLVMVTRFETDSDLVTGMATITVNTNFDADGTGPAWGTISIAPDASVDGTWVGTWQGVRVKVDDQTWVILVHGSAKGTGELEGMIYSAVDDITSYSLEGYPSVLVAYTGILKGRIIDPHSK